MVGHSHYQRFRTPSQYATWLELQNKEYMIRQYDYILPGIFTLLREGDNSRVDEIIRKAEALSARVTHKTNKPQLNYASSGPMLDAGAFLSGSSNYWMRPQPTPTKRGPIHLYTTVMSSGGVSDRQLQDRGAAIAALVLCLKKYRPVKVSAILANGSHWPWHKDTPEYMYNARRDGTEPREWYEFITVVDLPTQPLVVTDLIAVLSNVNVTRYSEFATTEAIITREYGSYEPYSRGSTRKCGIWCPHDTDEPYMRAKIGMNVDDIYIPAIHLHDPILDDPEKWVLNNLKRYME